MRDVAQLWANFFVAEAGAAAALAGLVFVAVSINLGRVLEFPSLPRLALETLGTFGGVLVVCTLGLVPAQPVWAFGAEVGAVAALAGAWQALTFRQRFRLERQYGGFVARTALTALPALCFAAAAARLVRGDGAGVYWLVPGTLLSFVAGLYGAWVLLVEIHR